MQTVMDAPRIRQTIAQLAQRLLDDPGLRSTPTADIALIGIRSRGELIAERLAAEILARRGLHFLVGALDITMYRDDLAQRGAITIPQGTDIHFGLDDKTVILIDDVLDTGRSVRAALDALVDFGRPRLIRLAALIDRGRREFPIAADYIGLKLQDVPPDQKVLVRLQPTDPEDVVYLS